jgi:Cu/Ag efflux pump CusA
VKERPPAGHWVFAGWNYLECNAEQYVIRGELVIGNADDTGDLVVRASEQPGVHPQHRAVAVAHGGELRGRGVASEPGIVPAI